MLNFLQGILFNSFNFILFVSRILPKLFEIIEKFSWNSISMYLHYIENEKDKLESTNELNWISFHLRLVLLVSSSLL